jgi:hypothetical protein
VFSTVPSKYRRKSLDPKAFSAMKLSSLLLMKLSNFLLIVAGLVAAIGPLILMGQVWAWLKNGEWYPLSVAAVLYGLGIPEPHPVQHLIGLQKIIDAAISVLLNCPASLAFVLIGGVFLTIAEKAVPPKGMD